MKIKTWIGYEVDVRCHVVPVIGGKLLAQITPEDVEKVYAAMIGKGRSEATVQHVRRTLSKALGDAAKRGHIPRNPVALAQAPRAEPPEIEPLTGDEARQVLTAAAGQRNGAAWMIALSLGLRRGEVLGLSWDDVDLDAGTLRVRHALQRHPGAGLVFTTPKIAAGRRSMALPGPLTALLWDHRHAQLLERIAAGSRWQDHGLVFAQQDGRQVDPDAYSRA